MIPQFSLLPLLTLIDPSQPPDGADAGSDFSAMFAEAMQQQPVEAAVDPGLPPDAILPVMPPTPPIASVKPLPSDDATVGVTLQTESMGTAFPDLPDGTGQDGFEPLNLPLSVDSVVSGPVSKPDSGLPQSTDPNALSDSALPAASLPLDPDPAGPAKRTEASPPQKVETPPKTEPKVVPAPSDAAAMAVISNGNAAVEMPPAPRPALERRIVALPNVMEAQAIVRVAAQTGTPTPLTEILLREVYQTQGEADSPVTEPAEAAPIDLLPLNTVLAAPDDAMILPQPPHDMAAPAHAPTKAAHNLIAPESVAPVVAAHARTPHAEPLEIVLNPQELGHLRFEIRHSGEQVSVLLTAERPETLDLMRRHADQLVTELRQSGFSEASLSFGQWAQGGETPPQPVPIDDHAENAPQFTPFTPTPHWPRRSDLGGTGLNLRL